MFFLLKLLFFALNILGRGVFDVYFADIFDFSLVFFVLFSYKSAYKLFISGSILSDLVFDFVKQSVFLCKSLWFFPLIYLFSGEFIYIELYSVCRLSCQFYASFSWFSF